MKLITEQSTEAEALDALAAIGIPTHLRAGLVRYVLRRVQTGGFLRSILEGDSEGAKMRADGDSRAAFNAGAFDRLFSILPPECRGSVGAVDIWLGGRS